MRKFFYIIPLLLTAFVFLESCICSTTNTKSSFTSLSIPINVIWSETSYIDPPLLYYMGEANPYRKKVCFLSHSFRDETYYFRVVSGDDSISFTIPKYYIGSNVDSVNVMIDWAADMSSIFIVHGCTWAMHGKWFCRGSRPMNDFCGITATKPVHAAVFVLSKLGEPNNEKNIYEFIQENQIKRLDSIIQSLPEP